ncbi:anti-sigma factor [Rhizobiaceae bacterium n13]|uniref:Anti-sigma factor n=1 Tax=Ferirhizobium litorale TaxID=2927786 RepID=A0AAE3U0T5_9HYPH|nr:anti-sigma factor [Fererhizobium litorale]MDI7862322.1 anti-sigma factor [Fererhizobium litorale]MDI7922404.1 anti-sigma factor [Fererhizobium litorale]
MTAIDPILESELHAYVDDQLDVARRIEVEAYLSENPSMAAQVMADLSTKGELRLALANQSSTLRAETREAARKLERSLSQWRVVAGLQRAAAVIALVGAGWIANSYVGPFSATEVIASVPPPIFVEEAVRAHQTTMLRETMPSQAVLATYDPNDIRAATAIVMPEVPKDWSVVDVQIYPSAFGPSVEMVIEPKDGERLSLFAVRPGSFAVQRVLQFNRDGVEASYWQIGEVAYALVSDGKDAVKLSDAANKLLRTLY